MRIVRFLIRLLFFAVTAALLALVTWAEVGTLLAQDASRFLHPGEATAGEVVSSAGERWQFVVCSGDDVTMTMSSSAFAPYLEVSDAKNDLITEGIAQDDTAVAAFVADENTLLQVLATGERRSDRGQYTLALASSGLAATLAADGFLAPGETVTGTVRRSTGETWLLYACAGDTITVTLASQAGSSFAPFLEIAGADDEVIADDDGSDDGQAEVAALTFERNTPLLVTAAGATNRARGAYSLTVASTLGGVGVAPAGSPTRPPASTATRPPAPTPTRTPRPATPTRTPTPRPVTPTPTPPALVILPGGSPGDTTWLADITTGPELLSRIDNRTSVFRDGFYLRLEVYRVPRNRRIQQVNYFISSDDTGEEVHTQEEGSPGYCSFGGGTPDCNVLWLESGARWPSTGLPVCNGDYSVSMEVVLDDGNSANWDGRVRLDSPRLPACSDSSSQPSPDLLPIEAAIVETGPGTSDSYVSGVLRFHVAANDPNVGSDDGAGIDYVDMWVYDSDGNEVRYRKEQSPGYCVFEGGTPDCNDWVFADHDYTWPQGAPFQPGSHLLYAVVHADDGRTVEVQTTVELDY